MLTYAARRLLGAIPTLLVILTITFFLVRLAPGGPFDGERTLLAEIERNLAAAYHLDEPLPLQYFRYLGQVLQGDFGPSFKYKDFSVTQLIWSGFPVSLQLGGTAMLLAVVIGTALGAFAALRQNSGLDYGVMGAAMVGIAVPNFVIAPLLTLVLGVHLGVLPTGGWGSWQQMLLPVLALALPQIAYIARMTRASMIELLRSNFIRTARAKGLPERVVLFHHTMRNALLPMITLAGLELPVLLSGALVTETVFTWPGMGRLFLDSLGYRDYPVVMGILMFSAVLVLVGNLLADCFCALADPRIRLD